MFGISSLAMEVTHLSRSLQSLRSICLKKISNKDLVDDKELLGLFRTTRGVILNYQRENQLPELQIVLDRLPDPSSFEKRPPLFEGYRFVYTLGMALISGVLFLLSPFFGLGLLILVTGFDIFVRLYMARRLSVINDNLRQIADACSSIEMVIRNNETYKQPY